ncbi:MAG TPA: metal ABC transporter permease [Candidatus Eremiobacteraeota bacterium]|nr:MAG: High-affinity zinc uptake system membrane protein ZnuB [bacterium ADurb.Bin363]HPZ10336.1 metal ABC transporter permease [Candidatus Eremiobacteraeota bacterium]
MELWYWFLELLPFSWVEFDFMKNALLSVILVSFLFGHLGAMVINRQMAFFSDAIGHAALTGIAIGVLLGFSEPLWVMIIFAIILSFGISYLRRISLASADTIIGLFMSFALALGVVLLSRGGNFNKYSKYLIGDILSITSQEIGWIILVILLVILFWIFHFNKLFLLSLNPSVAKSRKVNIWSLDFIFSALVAVVVTMSIQWIGLLVINSLLILPPSAARNIAKNTFQYIWISVIISLISGITGLMTSFYMGTATGATIVLFAMAFFLVSLTFKSKV